MPQMGPGGRDGEERATRAIAFGIYRPVAPAKAGVQRPLKEDTGNDTGDFGHRIPAFAGMTVAGWEHTG